MKANAFGATTMTRKTVAPDTTKPTTAHEPKPTNHVPTLIKLPMIEHRPDVAIHREWRLISRKRKLIRHDRNRTNLEQTLTNPELHPKTWKLISHSRKLTKRDMDLTQWKQSSHSRKCITNRDLDLTQWKRISHSLRLTNQRLTR